MRRGGGGNFKKGKKEKIKGKKSGVFWRLYVASVALHVCCLITCPISGESLCVCKGAREHTIPHRVPLSLSLSLSSSSFLPLYFLIVSKIRGGRLWEGHFSSFCFTLNRVRFRLMSDRVDKFPQKANTSLVRTKRGRQKKRKLN